MPAPSPESLLDALLTGAPVPEPVAEAWRREGLSRLDVLGRLTHLWVEQVGPSETAERLLPAVLEHAAAAPDPDGALLALARMLGDHGGMRVVQQAAEDPRFGHDLFCLLGLGAVPAEALWREPGLSDLLMDRESLAVPADPQHLIDEAMALVRRLQQPENRRNALRRWKRGQFLRLFARDFLRREPQQVITAEISAIADACCRAALAAAAHDVFGLPIEEPLGLAVIGMGKWGSRELNYNSDIDLICVYDGSHGVSSAGWEPVVRAMSRELDEPTAEGRVFAVDFRLRPEGGGSSLVRSLEGCAAYYQGHSAAWEALALTRARFVAGDASLGQRFEALATQIAYGTRMRGPGIEAIRHNRRLLDDRSDADRNVKEGRGGIRDIEFTAQLLQLVRGVTDPTVRERNTWDALAALARAGAISATEQRTLGESYDFLRRVEHLLQIQPSSPTKELPEPRPAMRRLARAMGYRDAGPLSAAGRFLAEYRSHTSQARDLCNRLFFNPIPLSSPDAGQRVSELLDPMADDAEVLGHLGEIPFADPAEARRRLMFLAHGEPPMRLPEEIQALFVQFLPALLSCIQRMPDPDAALRWLERFVSRAGGRELAYRFFLDHPTMLEVLTRIGGSSDDLSQTLVDHPEYLDRAVLASYAKQDPSLDDMADEMRDRLRPLRRPELRIDDLRRFRRREAFRIGVRDLLGLLEPEQVTTQLSDLAEACLRVLLEEVTGTIEGADSIRFAVIGCGKLGGRELHYSSDLDVLFVWEDAGQPDGSRTAERLAQALRRESELPTRAGRLYSLDARLRPYGSGSPMVWALASYASYYAGPAEPWERLALTRARWAAGDPELGERFCALARAFAFGPPPDEAGMESLRRIKVRIESERRNTLDRDHLDLKLEPGGIMDIEYATQVLTVLHGQANPSVAQTNTPAALEALTEAGILTTAEGDLLRRNYRLFRRLELRLQLVREKPDGRLPLDPAGLAKAAKRLGWSVAEASDKPEQFLTDLRVRIEAVRAVVVRHLGLA